MRLRIIGLTADGAVSAAELASRLEVRPRSLGRHLEMLLSAGLVRLEGDAYVLEGEALTGWRTQLLRRTTRRKPAAGVEERDEFERGVLVEFLDSAGRIRALPAKHKRRLVVLRLLAEDFQPGVRYPENEVNQIISRRHPDFALVRRALVDEELMLRHGGVYWRAGSLTYGR